MLSRLVCCAVFIAFTAAAPAATKSKAKGEAKPAAPQRLKGKTETLACRLGTEDRHARIAVVLIGGKTDSFAYYSKWKPRTCSIYLQRWRDSYSKWSDNGNLTTVDLERGTFLIEHKKGEYHFIFRDIDRERYCGMDGVINGGLTIRKGSDQCVLDGDIMVEGTPLGEAFASRDEKPGTGLPDKASTGGGAAGESMSQGDKPAVKAPAAPLPEASVKGAPTEAAAKSAPVEPAAKSAGAEPAAKSATPEAAASQAAAPQTAAPQAASAAAPAQGSTVAAKAPEKPAERSGNPISSFFRSLAHDRPPEQGPAAPGQ